MKKFEEMREWLAEGESGQDMVEYGLITVFIAVVAITALTTIGTSLKDKLEEIAITASK